MVQDVLIAIFKKFSWTDTDVETDSGEGSGIDNDRVLPGLSLNFDSQRKVTGCE